MTMTTTTPTYDQYKAAALDIQGNDRPLGFAEMDKDGSGCWVQIWIRIDRKQAICFLDEGLDCRPTRKGYRDTARDLQGHDRSAGFADIDKDGSGAWVQIWVRIDAKQV